MDQKNYSVVSDSNHSAYEFLSEGPKGIIKKVVIYQEIKENRFNLAFGDWDDEEQRINAWIRSNNNDRNKVLATVASTVIDFVRYHPNSVIIAQGSTPSRTRLYQMSISANWNEIDHLFKIEGYLDGSWEPFEQGKNYDEFVLTVK